MASEDAENQADNAEQQPVQGELQPDTTLAALYKSSRPPVELLPGVQLSAIINACWVPRDAKSMLADSWIPVPPEVEEGAEPPPPPPAFDPAAIEYGEMQKRLSKTFPLQTYNKLMIQIKEKELEVEEAAKDEVEVKTQELEALKGKLAETEAQIAEIKASFAEDPLSLVSWMETLFALADAGLTTFDVSGGFYPYTNLRSLFTGDNQTSYYEGPEKVLGTFKRRFERERGPNQIQILCKLIPNIYQDGYSPAVVEAILDKVRANVFGAEATDPLDLLQLYWWDVKDVDVLPTLKAMQKLAEDKLEVNEETGDVTIVEPKKLRGIGLVDFPARAILTAIQAGVPITSVQLPYSIADRSHLKTLNLCKEYGIKVFAREGLMGGLISEKYIGAPCPDTMTPDPDLDEVAHCLELVNHYGGWTKFQGLLKTIKNVADKHKVKLETVALRWQIDQGTFPIASMRWDIRKWRQFGYSYWRGTTPGLDYQLFQVESFLDVEDNTLLNQVAMQ